MQRFASIAITHLCLVGSYPLAAPVETRTFWTAALAVRASEADITPAAAAPILPKRLRRLTCWLMEPPSVNAARGTPCTSNRYNGFSKLPACATSAEMDLTHDSGRMD